MKKTIRYYYKDNRFAVTASDIRTPMAIYPILRAVARIRRVLILSALAFTALMVVALVRDFDVWTPFDMAVMAALAGAALWFGSTFSLLTLDGMGLPSQSFFVSSKNVHAMFEGIVAARADARGATAGGGGEEDDADDDEFIEDEDMESED
ncbi:MAG TPA: hypothetical protein PLN33_09620 [Hyphomonadaceae bacterium]|nr:hypothetical protein [Hyphomonadaceae bacterium]